MYSFCLFVVWSCYCCWSLPSLSAFPSHQSAISWPLFFIPQMFSPVDPDERIPLTEFSLGRVLSCLNASECTEWHRLGKVAKVRVDNLSGKGFLSAVHRLTFAFAQSQEQFRVILKVPTVAILRQIRPQDSEEKIAYLEQMIVKFHCREVAFYSKVAAHHLRDIPGLSPLIPRAWAWQDCGANDGLGQAFLLLEDLSVGGSAHADQLTEEQIDSVVVAMALFHAHSLAIPPELLKAHFSAEKTFRYDKQRLHQQLCALPGQTGAYFSRNGSVLAKFIEEAESFDPPVLCHGDLWVNNLLFGTDGKVKCILDWQCVHLGTGISDISHFLITGVEPALRRARTEHWLRLYQSTLADALSSLPKCLTTPLAKLDTIKAIYRTQFQDNVHFLMCLEAFFTNEPKEKEELEVREKMRQRLMESFDEIKTNYI